MTREHDADILRSTRLISL